MQFSSKLVFVLTSCLALSACAGSMPWESSKSSKRSSVPPITVTNKGDVKTNMARGANSVSSNDLGAMVGASSNGSVEVYNLDNNQPYGGRGEVVFRSPMAAAPAYNDGGMSLAADPSVTVFPLDGNADMYGQPMTGGAAQGYMPIPGNGAGDMGMYNAGGAAMDIDGGKNAPRTNGPVSSVYFDYGSSHMSGADKAALQSVAETAKFAPVDRVMVEGHASVPTQTNDPVESRILNLRESLKRAGTVAEKLIAEGVPAEKIKTVGWGDTKQSAGGESEQRRVDIVTGPGGY